MTENVQSRFSAADATLGYLYQVRSALLFALRQLRSDADFLVSVETLDDVTFETARGEPTLLLQTKHTLRRAAALSDASPDLWKTLRIWIEGGQASQLGDRTKLFLITTATVSQGNAASKLRGESRDVEGAQRALADAATSSTNDANRPAYEAYLRIDVKHRIEILERVVIIDAAPTVENLDTSLKDEVLWAAPRKHLGAFLERLEGWWIRRVVQQLVRSPNDRIGSVEIEAQMSDLREQFKPDALPIDEDLIDFALDEATKLAHEKSMFVQQLQLIRTGKVRIAAAIRDYYRAFEQRSRWLREDLVVGLDLHKYEKRLTEEWEIVFAAMRDNLGETAANDAQEKAARDVLAWAERVSIPIRPTVSEPFVSRGSFHMLSDDVRIGWHPDFRNRVAALLAAGAAAE